MSGIVQLATPWCVNLLILIPVAPYLISKKEKPRIGRKRLLVVALFAVAFGFVEAAVVVYLRAATGLWPSPPVKAFIAVPDSLLRIECFREAATMIMLCTVALLAGKSAKEKCVVFLWTFAVWDIFYYIWLRLTIGWPTSLITSDVLFLIPAPWVAQVWLPMLISGLTALVIWFRS